MAKKCVLKRWARLIIQSGKKKFKQLKKSPIKSNVIFELKLRDTNKDKFEFPNSFLKCVCVVGGGNLTHASSFKLKLTN